MESLIYVFNVMKCKLGKNRKRQCLAIICHRYRKTLHCPGIDITVAIKGILHNWSIMHLQLNAPLSAPGEQFGSTDAMFFKIRSNSVEMVTMCNPSFFGRTQEDLGIGKQLAVVL